MKRHFTRWPMVEGYTARQSYVGGESVEVHCSSRVSTFSVEVARVGRDRVVVWRQAAIRGREQPFPDDAFAKGCGWPVTFSIPVDRAWPSGFYEIAFTADGEQGEASASQAFFVVRATRKSTAPAILVLASNTYNAYNQWGGACLYSGAVKVSFHRPYERGYLRRPAAPNDTDYDGRVASVGPELDIENIRLQRYLEQYDYPLWCASGGWHNWERRFVRWAESNGIALDYAVNADLEFHDDVLDDHRLMLSVGHDEYWSWAMRDRVDDFVESGGSWAIFSGNTCFWQVRYEDNGATMVCFKGRAQQEDPVAGTDRHQRLSTMWSMPSIGRPEALSIGLSFTRGGYSKVGKATPRSTGGYVVHRPDHALLRGTDLRYGDQFGTAASIVGYEVDGCELKMVNGDPVPTGSDGTPANLEVIATAPARLISITATECEAPVELWASVEPPGDLQGITYVLYGDASPENVARLAHGHAVMGTFPKGKGRVFHAGTADWAQGLDRDPTVQTITRNVIEQLGGIS